jgi:hypothetical protein
MSQLAPDRRQLPKVVPLRHPNSEQRQKDQVRQDAMAILHIMAINSIREPYLHY